jgi:hypothetical protein
MASPDVQIVLRYRDGGAGRNLIFLRKINASGGSLLAKMKRGRLIA